MKTIVKAKLSYLRIAPRKVRLVADLIRNKKVLQAVDMLSVSKKRSAKNLLKLVNSAIANAGNNFKLKKEGLVISKITVDDGPTLKRWMPRARGRATTIRKRTSMIKLELIDLNEEDKAEEDKTDSKEKSVKTIETKETDKEIKKDTKVKKEEEKPSASAKIKADKE